MEGLGAAQESARRSVSVLQENILPGVGAIQRHTLESVLKIEIPGEPA